MVLDRTFVGGAELLLLNLFRHLDRSVVQPRLVCLREAGPLADEFRDAGVAVEVLDRRGRRRPVHACPGWSGCCAPTAPTS